MFFIMTYHEAKIHRGCSSFPRASLFAEGTWTIATVEDTTVAEGTRTVATVEDTTVAEAIAWTEAVAEAIAWTEDIAWTSWTEARASTLTKARSSSFVLWCSQHCGRHQEHEGHLYL